MTALEQHESVEAFYAADERRRRSPELDFGVWWRGPAALTYRLTWVDATGELILVQLSAPTLRSFAIDGDAGFVLIGGDAGTVTVLAEIADRGELEQLLAGWADVCGEPGSLAWIAERLAERATT